MPELQAARGASLSTSGDSGSTSGVTSGATTGTSRRRSGRRATGLVFAVAAVALLADVVSKHLAARELTAREPVRVIGDLLQLRLVRNPGAAFSTGTEFTLVFSLVAITAVCVVLWFSRRVADPVWAVAFGLLLAGIGGNLTDRIFRDPAPLRGHVVDLFMIPNWPVFNVADICIDVAAALILLQAFRNVRLDGSRPSRDLPEEKAA